MLVYGGMTVNSAILKLRQQSGKSQQVFATELGMSLRAYSKYEHEQMPEPRQLSAFLDCAHRTGQSDLAAVFEGALQQSLGIPYSTLFYGPSSAPSKRPEYSFNEKTSEAVRQCLSGHPDYVAIAPLVIQAVGETIEQLAEREHDPVRTTQLRMIRPQKKRKETK
jgi:transcriptional regulator with XRE-family HTH domain